MYKQHTHTHTHTHTGNFPWLKSVISFFFVRSEVGKLFFLLYSTAATLVKARRETGHPGRVGEDMFIFM